MDGSLRMAALVGLPQFLADHGLDPDAEIRRTGCDPAHFKDPENTIDFTAIGRLFEHTVAVTGHSFPGFELTRHLGLEVLGIPGKAMRFAPDLGTALGTLIRAFHLHDRGAVPFLRRNHQEATFGYTIHCPDVPGVDHIYDGALAIAQNVFNELIGPNWRAREVHFVRGRPTEVHPYRQHFRTQLLFHAEQAALVFASADLARPVATADPGAFLKAQEALARMDERIGDGLTSRVLRVLHRQFIAGAGPEGIDLQKVASILVMHPRTLNRRLQAEGTTFRELLAESRFDIARQLLRDTQLQVADISLLLGYAQTSSFDRAFRRWSGSTSTMWRDSMGKG
jgi:AraC-like DNA-binding protein